MTDHARWRAALEGWLDEQSLPDDRASVEGQLRSLLALVRALSRGLAATLEAVEVVDHSKYEVVEERLAQILGFDSFSLAEVSFRRPDRGQPGLRLWLEGPAEARRVSVVFFEDVVQWRASFAGEKLSTTLLTLELGEGRLAPTWRDEMVEVVWGVVERALAASGDRPGA